MNFCDWVDEQRGEISRTAFLREFSARTAVSLQTLQFVMKGGRMSFYHKAQAISQGTHDAVSIQELCE